MAAAVEGSGGGGGIEHRYLDVNGIRMHVAEQGSGPIVLLLHGFPETWYSWRHQIPALAAAGFHAVAPDMRGYGDTDAPSAIRAFTAFHLVGDLIALLDAFGEQKAFVVGHDWGAAIAWYLCILRPDRVKALTALSIPIPTRKSSGSMTMLLTKAHGEGFYMTKFQEPGKIEAEFAKLEVKTVLKKFFAFFSQKHIAAKEGQDLLDHIEAPETFSWISDDELNYYTAQFQKSGFSGPINYYRNIDLNWELMSPWDNVGSFIPSLYISGEQDGVLEFAGMREFVYGGEFKKQVPNLKEIVTVSGGHFIQQEKPKEVNEHLIKFFLEQSTETLGRLTKIA